MKLDALVEYEYILNDVVEFLLLNRNYSNTEDALEEIKTCTVWDIVDMYMTYNGYYDCRYLLEDLFVFVQRTKEIESEVENDTF